MINLIHNLLNFITVLSSYVFLAPQPTHHTGPAAMKPCKQRKNSSEMVTPWNCVKAVSIFFF